MSICVSSVTSWQCVASASGCMASFMGGTLADIRVTRKGPIRTSRPLHDPLREANEADERPAPSPHRCDRTRGACALLGCASSPGPAGDRLLDLALPCLAPFFGMHLAPARRYRRTHRQHRPERGSGGTRPWPCADPGHRTARADNAGAGCWYVAAGAFGRVAIRHRTAVTA